MPNEQRQTRMLEHVARDAAERPLAESPMAVRAHDEQIGRHFFRCTENFSADAFLRYIEHACVE